MRYAELAAFYDTLEATSKRLDKTWHVAQLLSKTGDEDLKHVVLLIQGRVFPTWDERKLGIAEKLIIKAISKATGAEQERIESEWAKTGDLGKVAEHLCGRKSQQTLVSAELPVRKVFGNLQKLAELEGRGSVDAKLALLAELLSSASPREARYIVRTALEQLRLGVGAGILRDAIAWAFLPKVAGVFVPCGSCGALMPSVEKCLACGKPLKMKPDEALDSVKKASGSEKNILGHELKEALASGKAEAISAKGTVLPENGAEARSLHNSLMGAVQHAYDVTNDFSQVARTAKREGLQGLLRCSLELGSPVKVMLAIKEETLGDALRRVGTPAAAEYKLDGFRMQVHKDKDSVRIFTRKLEEVTAQFPEIVAVVKEKIPANSAVLDGEAVGFDPKTRKYMPFQAVSQRIRRKYGIEEMARDFPVQLNVFDVLYLNGRTVLDEPFSKRRKMIEGIVPGEGRFLRLAEHIVSSSEEEVTAFFGKAQKEGHEGLMIKKLDAPYKPGARVGHMVKYKEVMEGLDLVIVGAEHGEGKRAGWLTSFTVACLGQKGELLELGKVSTGLKERPEGGLSYPEMTDMLTPLLKSEGKESAVAPKLVVEVHYEEIQKSPNYSSGYALRFPRIIRLREDKGREDASTLKQVTELYSKQRHRGG